ncbi:unnamed protein product [Penicillium olsonii]|uniref:Uncharacterized protein n=1 Tax=Penicillium olsonii TaxID=99116 RepID=A0A9W4HT09_PENOL|nr:unnamed protein product [Penicillium olsonii]CAG8146244.1 unnamed protein product [Penicillium olsonii]
MSSPWERKRAESPGSAAKSEESSDETNHGPKNGFGLQEPSRPSVTPPTTNDTPSPQPRTPPTTIDTEEMSQDLTDDKMTEPEANIKSDERSEDSDMGDGDSDLGDGDAILARGDCRDPAKLTKYGFRPVWHFHLGYPEPTIPLDIQEYLTDGKRRGTSFVGPLRSIAWLAGLDELVEAIDSPVFAIQDSIETVPFGCELTWPVEYHILQGTIPLHIVKKVCPRQFWGPDVDPLPPVQYQCPAGITDKPALYPLAEISAESRLKGPNDKILCARIKSNKNLEVLERQIHRMADGMFESGQFLFRSVHLSVLRCTLAFFIPHVSTNNKDNEFGPGIYTTTSLSASLKYLRSGVGAIMVFRNPALERASVWQPSLRQWEAWVSKWLDRSLVIARGPTPPEYYTADFIQGAISGGQLDPRSARLQVPIQSEDTQVVAVSYRGCEILNDAFYMLIFVGTA